MQSARVADIAIDPRSGGSEALFSYRVSDKAVVGDAFFVPLGNRSTLGFAVRIYDATEEDLGFPLEGLKDVLARVDNLALPQHLVDLVAFVADEYLCPLPTALTAATPPGIRERIVTTWSLVTKPANDVWSLMPDSPSMPQALTPAQAEVVRVLSEAGGKLIESRSKPIPAGTLKSLKLLRGKGIVAQSLQIAPFAERRKNAGLLRLTSDSGRIEEFLLHEGKKKPAQALVLIRLQAADAGATLAAGEIKAMSGVTDTTIKALIDAGLLEKSEGETGRMATPPVLNRFQSLATDAVIDAIATAEYRPFLLFGVTGSGKTEVYLRAAAEALKQGRQVLYLVPEIALAAQAIAQLRERFGKSVTVLHSDLSPGERLQNWMAIRDGDASIVLGARSALFAPLQNIGLIVVDEEHEASYKQESAPRYHSKRLALFLGAKHACPVVLGSATPSIESFFEAEQEQLTLLSLPERAASASLPKVYIDDLTEGYRSGKPAILSPDLHARLARTLEHGQQAILFLNRRAYAPFLVCRDCGHQMMCPNCAVSLSYHRRDRKLRCHHCGYNRMPPDTCPKCGGLRLNAFGVGTEKVEENVSYLFPEAKVARLDRDIARKKGALEEILASFRAGDINILVGTQMVAKGLDFPNVTLVGVIAADVSLNIPDFRSSERTFQLLSQVAGRAGRGAFPGEVVIQTFNPSHAAVITAQTHDYLTFYEALKEERDAANYPPFKRLVNVVLSGENRRIVLEAAGEAAERLKERLPVGEILGPVDCAVERLQNRWRRHLLIKLPSQESASVVGAALAGMAWKGVQLVLDVDPYSLM